jgi:ABC-type Mn2+/Zn2+ transport system permease subunit
MVFSFLVAPAIIALSHSKHWLHRILFAWSVGILASTLGLYSSYQWDLPSGPAIVCILGLLLVVFAIYRGLRSSKRQTTDSL